MKYFAPLFGLGLGVALAVIIGQEMGEDAMTIVIAMAASALFNIPTTLIIYALLNRAKSAQRVDYAPPMPMAMSDLPPMGQGMSLQVRPEDIARMWQMSQQQGGLRNMQTDFVPLSGRGGWGDQ